MRRALIPSLLLLAAVAMPAAAQDSGGLGLSQEALASGGPRGLARPLRTTFPNFTAADLQAMPTPAERRQRHQEAIARVRGDGGLLDGFGFGQPRAASRQPPPPPVEPVFAPIFIDQRSRVVNRYEVDQRTRVVNRFEAPVAVTVGNGNVVQQQGARGGGGPTAQQQVATIAGRSGRDAGGIAAAGATNLVTPEGSIVQQAPRRGSRAQP